MPRETLMENVWVPVPYLVLSMEMHLRGQMEKHLLTPFGYVDIRFPAFEDEEPIAGHCYEVTVATDLDSWRCGDTIPVEFRQYVLHFVRGIVASNWSGAPMSASQLKIRLIQGEMDMAGGAEVVPLTCPQGEATS